MKIHSFQIICIICAIVYVAGCAGPSNLTSCGTIIKSDSVQYLAPGMRDHSELKSAWLKEEVKKEQVHDWFRNYIKKGLSDRDTSLISASERQRIESSSLKWINEEWKVIENKITEEDKIYYYSTPDEYWHALAGQDGLVIIRNCRIMYVLILRQS